MTNDRVLVVKDAFNISGRGLCFCIEYIENWKEYVGEKVYFTGRREGIYLITEGEQFRGGIYDDGREKGIGYLVEEIK